MESKELNNQTAMEQCHDDVDMQNVNDSKKKKSDKRVFITAISTGLAAIIALYSFVGALITWVPETKEDVNDIISSIVFTDENIPNTWLERYKLYDEFNNVDQWDYAKYVDPIVRKAGESVSAGCDNYHVLISIPIVFDENDLMLHCRGEIDVDGNVAHGFVEVNYYDHEVRTYDSTTNTYSGLYYDNKIEFYRILENNKIITYMSLDGENWLVKDGFPFNQNNVMFDVKSLMCSINSEDATWFPNYYNNEEGNFISLSFSKTPYSGIMTNSDALYYECNRYRLNEVNITLHKDSYLPGMIASSMAQVDESKLVGYFGETGDSVLNQICESEIEMWPVYFFDQYGEISIETPDCLESAKHVDSFSELFVDLKDAIAEYTMKSKWR